MHLTSWMKRWRSAVLISLGAAIGPLDTAVNIAFPAITTAFALPIATIQWVVICYVLTYASLLLSCGRLGDVIGHKQIFLFGLCWSAASLWLCASATTFGWFLFFRCLQGIGTALVFSCAPALVTLAFPETERGKILGVYTMLAAVASTLGPLLGGQLIALWGWSAVFVFRVPIALLAAICAIFWVHQPVAVAPGQRFDSLGALTLTAAIVGLLLVINQGNHFGWLALPTVLLGCSAAGCLAFFIWHERRAAEPVLDLALFQHAAFTMANTAHVLINLASFTVLLLVPYYLLNAYRASALFGGLLLAMSPCGSMLASPLGGWFVSRFTSRHISLWGICLAAAGLFGISQWQEHTSPLFMTGTLLLQGFGAGLFHVANMDFVMGLIPRHQQGVAGSLTMLTRTIGVVAGATLGSFVLALFQKYYSGHFQAMSVAIPDLVLRTFILAFQGTLQCAAAVALLAGVLLWYSPGDTSRAR